ncbi:MAG: GNAT family N-acetyltransferase [Spirosomataceae bacterium]
MSPQPIIFRKATLSDVEDLVRLRIAFLKELQKPETRRLDDAAMAERLRDYFRTTIESEEFVAWVALQKGEIVATSGLCFFHIAPGFTLPEGKKAYILNIYTLPEWRGKGIGTKIFECILEEAKKRGYQRISLHASEDGRPVYEKFGFRLTGDEMELRL